MDRGKFSGFDLELRGRGIAWFQFTTPERLNGLTVAIKRDLIELLTQAQMDNAVRVIVFTGSGRAFCAGDDLKGYRDAEPSGRRLMPGIEPGHDTAIGTYDGLRSVSQRLNSVLRGLDKLTVAALNGVAIQTGLSLALSCDFRLAASSARMGSATLRFGLLPDEGGQYLLVRMLGLARALDFVLRKRIVSAEEALALGLVHEVVEPDELESAAMALATELAAGPQVAMRLLKRSLYSAAELDWEHALDEIAAKTAIADHHADVREGTRAFFEKREPQFNAWLEDSESPG
jgi:2-(1,2-epoxy-1,2-dihydrophenyl)acetyl-CoA isomerase